MKIHARVIGHELIKRGDLQLVKVKLQGTGVEPFRATVVIAQEDRIKYPFGCSATVDFDVQQDLNLEASIS